MLDRGVCRVERLGVEDEPAWVVWGGWLVCGWSRGSRRGQGTHSRGLWRRSRASCVEGARLTLRRSVPCVCVCRCVVCSSMVMGGQRMPMCTPGAARSRGRQFRGASFFRAQRTPTLLGVVRLQLSGQPRLDGRLKNGTSISSKHTLRKHVQRAEPGKLPADSPLHPRGIWRIPTRLATQWWTPAADPAGNAWPVLIADPGCVATPIKENDSQLVRVPEGPRTHASLAPAMTVMGGE